MKRNLLFIMNHLVCGGAEKSLISLLNSIDYSKYNVDLFLFNHRGMFLKQIPEEVHLLSEPPSYKYFDTPFSYASSQLIKQRKIKSLFHRGVLGFLSKFHQNSAVVEQKFWPYLSKSLPKLDKYYDAAIGFQEKNPIYFCCDHVNSKIKIGWFHTDLEKLNVIYDIERKYINQLDYVVTVTENLSEKLKKIFPEHSNKFRYIQNISSDTTIKKLSNNHLVKEMHQKNTTLVSVGRLAYEKNPLLTLKALHLLIKKGYNLTWFIIGEGDQRSILEEYIFENHLENHVCFLGMLDNPYPYIKQADIFIQTSKYEGNSISINEAKILAKPIVITNFETANSHILHNYNGFISEMDPESVAAHIERLINDHDLKENFVKNLKKEYFGTEYEINKFYSLVQ